MRSGLDEKIERPYTLTCSVFRKKIEFRDTDSKDNKTNQTTLLYFLIPWPSTEKDLFLDAWLKDSDDVQELVGIVGSPLNKPGRFGLHRANKNCPTIHLHVMSTELEEEIRNYMAYLKDSGQKMVARLTVKIIPCSEEFTEEFRWLY